MSRIAKRTNRTRDEQRPPRLSPPVNVAILASLGFVRRKPAHKPVDPHNSSTKRQGTSNPGLPNQPSAKVTQAAKALPEAKKLPEVKEPPAAKEPAKAKIEPEPPKPLVGRKRITGSQPAARKSTPVDESPAAKNPPKTNEPPQAKNQAANPQPPTAREQAPAERPAPPKPLYARGLPPSEEKPPFGSSPTGGTQQPPNRPAASSEKPGFPKLPTTEERRSVPGEEPKMKDQPTPPPAPTGSNPQTPPDEPKLPGIKAPGMNGSSQASNGSRIPPNSNGGPMNGSRAPMSGNGSPTNGSGAPTNGNGKTMNGNGAPKGSNPMSDRKFPGMNGRNGNPPRSSLFRPGAFATLPVMRIPPKAGGPVQKPPTQIPMELSQGPDEQPIEIPRDESQPESQKPIVPPAPVNAPSSYPVTPKPAASNTPNLDQVLKQNENLPSQAVVFGVCEDGLPMLLDLQDPAPGAVVVIGDQRDAQLEFLRTAITSLAGRNSPRSAQFLVFSCEPEAWKKWIAEKGFDRHCLAVESADEGLVRDWIIRLAEWAEQRRLGQSSGPSVLLVMDTLSFLPQLEYDVRLNFDWMAKEGPPAQIWPLAVISTDLAKSLSGRRLLRGFQTRIIGYANQPGDYMQLAGLDEQEAKTFGRRGEFAVKVGASWLRFKLPGI